MIIIIIIVILLVQVLIILVMQIQLHPGLKSFGVLSNLQFIRDFHAPIILSYSFIEYQNNNNN